MILTSQFPSQVRATVLTSTLPTNAGHHDLVINGWSGRLILKDNNIHLEERTGLMCPSKGASEQKTQRLEFCLNLIVDINEHLQNASFPSLTVCARATYLSKYPPPQEYLYRKKLHLKCVKCMNKCSCLQTIDR